MPAISIVSKEKPHPERQGEASNLVPSWTLTRCNDSSMNPTASYKARPRSSGGAYANRPKLRGRKIAVRTHSRPVTRVPNGTTREGNPTVPTREGLQLCPLSTGEHNEMSFWQA